MMNWASFLKMLVLGALFSLALLSYTPKIDSGKDISRRVDNKPVSESAAGKQSLDLEPPGEILQNIQDTLARSAPVLAAGKSKPNTDRSSAKTEEATGTSGGITVAVTDALVERPIDKKSIVATQCIWDYTVPENVNEDPRFHEQIYAQGSGVIISPAGHILTADHVIESDLAAKPDPAGKKWFLKKCQAAFNEDLAPLPYNSPRFKDVEVSFQPAAEERAEFDFAVLKFKEGENYAFTAFFDLLADDNAKEKSLLLIGYPGSALTGKRELKTIEFFSNLEKFQLSDDKKSALFYEAGSGRYQASSESYKKFQKELFDSGQDDRLVRGGFSGSPVFFRGYLFGIVTSSSVPNAASQDTVLVLSSYSISELLKKHQLF